MSTQNSFTTAQVIIKWKNKDKILPEDFASYRLSDFYLQFPQPSEDVSQTMHSIYLEAVGYAQEFAVLCPNICKNKPIYIVKYILHSKNSFISQSYAWFRHNNHSYFNVLSQLPVTRRFITGIQAMAEMGASCIATVTAWAPDNKGHIFACLSHPPLKTVVPSSFQAEHKTFLTRKEEI